MTGPGSGRCLVASPWQLGLVVRFAVVCLAELVKRFGGVSEGFARRLRHLLQSGDRDQGAQRRRIARVQKRWFNEIAAELPGSANPKLVAPPSEGLSQSPMSTRLI